MSEGTATTWDVQGIPHGWPTGSHPCDPTANTTPVPFENTVRSCFVLTT